MDEGVVDVGQSAEVAGGIDGEVIDAVDMAAGSERHLVVYGTWDT